MINFKLSCAYNNKARNKYRAGHGQSIIIEDRKSGKLVIFDLGNNGDDLLYNLNYLDVDVDSIDAIILSHGHYDHAGGIPKFLSARTTNTAIPIYLHPVALKPKIKVEKEKEPRDIGYPKIPKNLTNYAYIFTRDLHPVTDHIIVSGEIKKRDAKESGSPHLFYKPDDDQSIQQDPFKDDMSVFIIGETEGVLLCGCCHTGLMNVIAFFERKFPNKKLKAIVGGTHMMNYTKMDLEAVISVLKNNNKPLLYLNHCSGEETIQYLRNKFGKKIVKPFHVGDQLELTIV